MELEVMEAVEALDDMKKNNENLSSARLKLESDFDLLNVNFIESKLIVRTDVSGRLRGADSPLEARGGEGGQSRPGDEETGGGALL